MIFKNASAILTNLILLIIALSLASQNQTYDPTRTNSPRQQSTDPAYTDDSTFQSTALNNQNWYREQHAASPMTWNTSLAFSSLAWSEQCIWQHSGSSLPYGESVFGGYNTLADGIDAWGLERVNYNWNDPGFSESTGHFTQIVWKATTQVGCSRTLCAGGWWVVCHYSPPGNMIGIPKAFTINVGKQISGSLSVGITGDSFYILPSSPVTIPETQGNAGGLFSSTSDGSGLRPGRPAAPELTVLDLLFWGAVL